MKLSLFVIIYGFSFVEYAIALVYSTPASGNCGDDTVLTCQETVNFTSWGWFGLGRSLTINGHVVRPSDAAKYTDTRNGHIFSLTIHQTSSTDQEQYRCYAEFTEILLPTLRFECRASTAVLSIERDKRVSIELDKLYPVNPSIISLFYKATSLVNISGSNTCSDSPNHPGFFRCVWISSNSFSDGSYTYIIRVTTITESVPLNGSFFIASPKAPTISNVKLDELNRTVLYCINGQSLTLECLSSGGSPLQTVVWYKDSMTPSNILSMSSSGVKQNDGSYSVLLQHTLTPTSADDRKTVICRSYYPEADINNQASVAKNATLLFVLMPNVPLVSQISSAVSGGTFNVVCSTSNSRPEAAIIWMYRGVLYNGTLTSTLDPSSDTYTSHSVFSRSATTVDNGQIVHCIVKQPALTNSAELSSNITVTVLYPPTVTVEATNTSVKVNRTTLMCKASGNPSTGYTYGKWIQSWPGYGLVSEYVPQNDTLDITFLTYEHSGVYICSVSNGIKVVGTEQEYIQGSVYLLVKSNPVIVEPKLDPDKTEKISGKLGSYATIDIAYYSNAGITDVRCFRYKNGTRQTGNVCTTFDQDTMIKLPVFFHMVSTTGVKTTISIKINSADDFGLYDLVVTNEIDSVVLKLEIIQPEEFVSSSAAMIGGVVGGLCALALISIAVVVLLKRKGLLPTVAKKKILQKSVRSTEMSAFEESVTKRESRNTYEELQTNVSDSEREYSKILDKRTIDKESPLQYECLDNKSASVHTYSTVAQGK